MPKKTYLEVRTTCYLMTGSSTLLVLSHVLQILLSLESDLIPKCTTSTYCCRENAVSDTVYYSVKAWYLSYQFTHHHDVTILVLSAS